MATMFDPNQSIQQNPEAIDIARQRKLADLLTAQGAQTPQGQTVAGGIYVPPNPLEYVGKLFNTYVGVKGNEALDQKQAQLAEALRAKTAEDLGKFHDLMSNPETRPQALQFAANSTAPQLQALAAELYKPQKLSEGDVFGLPNIATGEMTPLAQGGTKLTSEMKDAAIILGLPKDATTWTPQQRQAAHQYAIQMKQAGATNISVNTGQHGFDNALKLRSDFRSEPIYKGFEEIKAAKNQIDQAATMASPAGDLAAATKIMKILDPGSVVRESELGMAMSAAGLGDKLGNYAQMIISGQKLTPDQRKDFVALSDKLYNSAAQQYNAKRGEYAGIAEANGLSVDAAAGKPAQIKEIKTNNFGILPSALDAELKRRGL